MRDQVSGIGVGALSVAWMLAGPVTYAIAVADTWHGSSAVWMKLLINVTIDGFLAGIWPATWAIWLFQFLVWHGSPLHTVFGL